MLEGRTYAIAELEKLTGFDRRTIVYYIQQGLVPRAGRRGPNTRYPYDCLLRLRFIRALKEQQDQGLSGTITLRDMHRLLAALDGPNLQALMERGPPPDEIQRLLSSPPAVPAPAPASAPAAAPPGPDTPATPAAAVSAAARAVGPPAQAAPMPPARSGVTGPSGLRRSYGLADAGIRQRHPVPPRLQPEPPRPHAEPPPAVAEPPAAPAAPPEHAAAHGGEPPAGGDLGDILRELEVRPGLAGRRLAPGASEHWTEIPITSRVFLSVRGLSAEDAPLADAAARELKKLLRVR